MRLKSVLPGLLFCFATGIGASLAVSAHAQQVPERIELSVVLSDGVDTTSITLPECDYLNPDLSGGELLFSCPLKPVYEVQFQLWGSGDVLVRYSPLEVRKGIDPTILDPRPVYVLQFVHNSPEKALAEANAMDWAVRPMAVLSQATQEPEPEPEPEPAPEPVAEEITVQFSWPAAYGSLSTADGKVVEFVDQRDSTVIGALQVGAGEMVKIVSNRNAECFVEVTAAESDDPVPVAFACEEREFPLPFAAQIDAPGCRQDDPQVLSCFLPNTLTEYVVDVPGWAPFSYVYGEVASVSADQLRPEQDFTSVPAALTAASEQSCRPQVLKLMAMGYCSAAGCTDFKTGNVQLAQGAVLPNLAEAGWDRDAMPNALQVQMVSAQGDAPVGVPGRLELGADLSRSIPALMRENQGGQTYPLDVTMDITQYKFGRQLRLYSDNQCESQIEKGVLDLSNPGNRAPQVPECAYFKLYDGDSARSRCTLIPFDAASQTARAELDSEPCAAKRLVVYVAQNSSLNGLAGQKIVDGLLALAKAKNAADLCAEIDIAHAVGERREVLLYAEDIYFAEEGFDFLDKLNMDFVNRTSEVLRDFEWIYRTWGDTLGGVVVVTDGAEVRVTDMIDSPAAMAWKIKEVPTFALNFDSNRNCEVFENTLLFGKCDPVEATEFEEMLTQAVDDGLDAVRSAQ